mmetsp:Transcript_42934/g.100848  ORF Transcript_42934/g.100848 Transcript_42934/m.100848 type:complete len:84 (+) Transcript_42934:989-1240(+)
MAPPPITLETTLLRDSGCVHASAAAYFTNSDIPTTESIATATFSKMNAVIPSDTNLKVRKAMQQPHNAAIPPKHRPARRPFFC